jgi:hypothetical protein
MTGILTNTSLTLNSGAANELVLSAPTNNDLFLTGTGSVTLTGVNNLTCSTAFNQGSPLTGLCMAFNCGSGSSTAGRNAAYGNGTNVSTGLLMPNNGVLVALGICTSPAVTSDASFVLVVNRTVTATSVSLTTGSQTNSLTAINLPFSAGDQLQMQCSAGPGSGTFWCVTVFVRFTA